MAFRLSMRSKGRLKGVHPDLVNVVHRAIQITEIDFGVTCGLRTLEEQRVLVRLGKSKTMNSRHLTGHAVDLVAFRAGEVSWEPPDYALIAKAMKRSALELHVPIEWGGDWKGFYDGPHFQLPWNVYPK